MQQIASMLRTATVALRALYTQQASVVVATRWPHLLATFMPLQEFGGPLVVRQLLRVACAGLPLPLLPAILPPTHTRIAEAQSASTTWSNNALPLLQQGDIEQVVSAIVSPILQRELHTPDAEGPPESSYTSMLLHECLGHLVRACGADDTPTAANDYTSRGGSGLFVQVALLGLGVGCGGGAAGGAGSRSACLRWLTCFALCRLCASRTRCTASILCWLAPCFAFWWTRRWHAVPRPAPRVQVW